MNAEIKVLQDFYLKIFSGAFKLEVRPTSTSINSANKRRLARACEAVNPEDLVYIHTTLHRFSNTILCFLQVSRAHV